jgi:Xaa-Pro dipeptidase
MKMIKPGVHWDDVHLHTHQVLTRGFLELGIFKRPSSPASAASLEAELLRLGLGAAFYPHGLGHSLGLDVHDVPSASKPVRLDERGESHGKGVADDKVYEYLRLRVPLQAGMVVVRLSVHLPC